MSAPSAQQIHGMNAAPSTGVPPLCNSACSRSCLFAYKFAMDNQILNSSERRCLMRQIVSMRSKISRTCFESLLNGTVLKPFEFGCALYNILYVFLQRMCTKGETDNHDCISVSCVHGCIGTSCKLAQLYENILCRATLKQERCTGSPTSRTMCKRLAELTTSAFKHAGAECSLLSDAPQIWSVTQVLAAHSWVRTYISGHTFEHTV